MNFKVGDRCKYGDAVGVIKSINKKFNKIEGEFFISGKLHCILFDLEGYVIPCGKFIDIPRLEKI